MLTNTAIVIICGILLVGAYAAAIAWIIYNIKKQEVKN